MRSLLVLLLVAPVGCATLHPVAQPKLPGSITSLEVLPRTAPHHILTQKKDGGVEAYVLWPGTPDPIRVHTWPGATNFRLSGYARGPVENVVIESAAGVEMYGLGDWDETRLSLDEMQTKKLDDFYTIRPLHPDDAWWRGLAVHEDGDARATGTKNPWRFFASEDGAHWGPMTLVGAAGPTLDVRRFGLAQMALQTTDGWRLFRRTAPQTWSAFDLPGFHGPVRDVEVQVNGEALGVAAGDGQPKTWFWWTDEGWKPIAEAIPGAPAELATVRQITEERVIALRPRSGPDAFEDQYFVRTESGWHPLQEVIPNAPAHIAQAREFAGNRALMLASKPTAEVPRPVVSAYWYDNVQWSPLATKVPDLANDIWEIIPAGPHGFGVRTAKWPADGKAAFGWQWFFERDGEWLPLESVLPAGTPTFAQAGIWMSLAAAVNVEQDDPTKPAMEQRVFVRKGRKLVAFEDTGKREWRATALATDNEPESMIRVGDSSEQWHWLLQEQGHWTDLREQLER